MKTSNSASPSSAAALPRIAVLATGGTIAGAAPDAPEVETFLAAHAGLPDEQGRRRLVRNGHAPERRLQTGIGPLEVRRPKLRDRGGVADGAPIRFTSAVLPAYLTANPFKRPRTKPLLDAKHQD